VRVQIFLDLNPLFATLLSGGVDVILETTLEPELGFQLEDRWRASGEGVVHLKISAQRFLSPQSRPAVQTEASMLDIRTRAALFQALDREGLSEGLQGGHRELAAFEIITPQDTLYPHVKDSLRVYPFDSARARALLTDLGWTAGADGVLRNSLDGRRFHTSITATPGRVEREAMAFADAWRRIGLEVDELVVPAAQVRNNEYRANYPGWEASAAGGGDGIIGRMEGPAASAQTRWAGNRGGYEDPRAQQLIRAYRTSVAESDQIQAMRAISDFVTAELPFLIMFSTAEHIAVRRGVHALDDHMGGDSAARPCGTYTRNSHLWDAE